jgi:hypothetical protein
MQLFVTYRDDGLRQSPACRRRTPPGSASPARPGRVLLTGNYFAEIFEIKEIKALAWVRRSKKNQ